MEGMDGFKFIHLYNEQVTGKESKIVLMTNYDRDDVITKAIDHELAGFLAKPITKSSLYDIMVENFYRPEGEPNGNGYRNSIRILLVEDNQVNQQIGKEMLEFEGCHVIIASNGLEAYEYLKSEDDFDYILMDLQMPVMDGYECADKIFSDRFIRPIPIIAMSADTSTEIQRKANNHHMTGFVTKPIDPYKLYEALGLDTTTLNKHNRNSPLENGLSDSETIIDRKKGGLYHHGGHESVYNSVLINFYNKYEDFTKRLSMC